jgi:hypothetical protein
MQLIDTESSLPTRFQDAFIEHINIDYSFKRALIKIQLCIGNPDAATLVA